MSLMKTPGGRKRDSCVWKYFIYLPEVDKSRCLILKPEGSKCGVEMAGKNATNLKSHVNHWHPETYEEFSRFEEEKNATKKRKMNNSVLDGSFEFAKNGTIEGAFAKKYEKCSSSSFISKRLDSFNESHYEIRNGSSTTDLQMFTWKNSVDCNLVEADTKPMPSDDSANENEQCSESRLNGCRPNCDRHSREEILFYCKECRVDLCKKCTVDENHQLMQHSLSLYEVKSTTDYRDQLEEDISVGLLSTIAKDAERRREILQGQLNAVDGFLDEHKEFLDAAEIVFAKGSNADMQDYSTLVERRLELKQRYKDIVESRATS